MLMTEVRNLFLAGFFFFGAGAIVAHIGEHDIVRITLQTIACNCFGLWLGMLLIYKARKLDDFVALTKGLDAFYADPNQSDLSKKLIANYAVDCLDEHVNRLIAANPVKDTE